MPELPEVETVRVGLQKSLPGLTIKKVEVLSLKSFKGDPKRITKKQVKGIWRKAKVLGIDLSSDLTILFHLKMSGQIIFQDGKKRLAGGHPTQDMRGEMPIKSTRVIFTFSNGSKLFFNDQRKFGWVKVISSGEVDEDMFLKGLGPEPLEKDFTWQILKTQILKRKNQPVKVALLDQQIISGIGNIYAAEACFIAYIDPRKKVHQLTDKDFKLLHKGVIKSLADGVKYGGSSRTHFVNTEGEKGVFLDYAFVYGRENQPCKRCDTTLKKIKLGGRGTVFCPTCQK